MLLEHSFEQAWGAQGVDINGHNTRRKGVLVRDARMCATSLIGIERGAAERSTLRVSLTGSGRVVLAAIGVKLDDFWQL